RSAAIRTRSSHSNQRGMKGRHAMKQRASWMVCLTGALLLCATGAQAQKKASQAEVDELKRALDAQEQSIRQLKNRINELEGEKPAAPAPAPVAKPAVPSPAEEKEAEWAAAE